MSRRHCDEWQRRPEIAREPDYLKFLAEAEKEAVGPEQYLDMNDEDGCGKDQEAGTPPEFSDKVAAESPGNAASNLVIRFDSQSSNEPLWTESSFEDNVKRCKKDRSDEEQEELMESFKTLHERKRWYYEVDKSGEENLGVLMRSASRVTKSEGKNFDTGMFTHSIGNPEMEKVLEQKMMENFRCWVPSVGTEFDREICSVLASEFLCVKRSIVGCPSLIPEPFQEDSRGHVFTKQGEQCSWRKVDGKMDMEPNNHG